MPKTAVGLFKNSEAAERAVQEIEASGFPRQEIRTLGELAAYDVPGVMSFPRLDFEVHVRRELTRIGASASEVEACAEGLRKGGVVVFATGTDDTVDKAAEVMNAHGGTGVEETNGPEPQLPGIVHESMTPIRESPVQAGRILQPGGGIAFFVW